MINLTIDSLNIEFISHCQFEKNLSPKTLKSYGIDLRQFVDFLLLKSYPKEITAIDKYMIKDYLQFISSAKPKTIKRKIATIKALFNYLEFEDIITINPFRKMRIQIKESRNLPNVMSLPEVEQVISSTYEVLNREMSTKSYAYAESIRNIAVIEVLFATGIRVSELSHLREESINLNNGQIRVLGKGNKERIVQICNKQTIKVLQDYNVLFKDKIEACGGFFFVNRFGHRLSEQSIRFLVKKQAKVAGINRRVTPHSFRHSFATLLLEQDVDIKYIQHLLGHSSIVTTQIYTHVNGEKQRQILQKHPRESFTIKSLVS